MRAAIYCRVSTEEQAKHGESIEDQKQALIKWAVDSGHSYKVYADEGCSAHKAFKTRKKLMELLSDVEKGEIDIVIFTKLDRWTRKAADYYKIQEVLDKHKVGWKAILEDYETVTSDGRFKVGIMLSVNQHEAERTSDRLKFTFEQKRRRGEIVSGNMPRGYTLKDHKPVKSDEAPAIEAFWKGYLSNGLTAGVRAAYNMGVNIPMSSACFMLQNAAHYAGKIQNVPCEPYLTQEQADAILASRTNKKKANYAYIFSGLATCGECSHKMGAHTLKRKRKDGSVYELPYYNCCVRHRTLTYSCENSFCPNEEILERYCLDNIAVVLDARRNQIIAEQENARAKTANSEKIIENLNRKKARAYEAYIDGLVSKTEFEKQSRKIEAELETLQNPMPITPTPQLPNDWRELYTKLDNSHKRLFWLGIIKEIRVFADKRIEIVPF